MQLEEMKIAWENMSEDIRRQKKLTDSLIINMTKLNYRQTTRKITVPETIGNFMCIIMVLFIAVNFKMLHPWYLQGCGIIALITLLVLPILSFGSIHTIRSAHVLHNNYKEMLTAYSRGKKKFVAFQKANYYLGAILLLVILPVTGQLIAGKDVFKQNWIWLWYSTSFIFFYFLSNWVFRRYITTINEAENILKELEE